MTEGRRLPEDVISFLRDEYRIEMQEEGDVTVPEVAAALDTTDTTARKMLREQVEKGVLVEIKGRLLSGGTGYFYRRAQNTRSA